MAEKLASMHSGTDEDSLAELLRQRTINNSCRDTNLACYKQL